MLRYIILIIILILFIIIYKYKYIETYIDFNKILNNYIDTSKPIKEEQKELNKIDKIIKEDNENILNKSINTNNIIAETIPEIKKEEQPKLKENLSMNDMKCQFYSKCPEGYTSNGYFSILGSDISCGGNDNFKKASLVAETKDKQISKIHIIDKGSGYDSSSKIKVVGGTNGIEAQVEPLIDDNGSIVAIKIINNGTEYTDTPLIEIINNNNKCELCCKKNI